jgi:hypothetical protein
MESSAETGNSSTGGSQSDSQDSSSDADSSVENDSSDSSPSGPEYDNLVIDPTTGLPDYSKMEVKGTAELTFKELGIALYEYEVVSGVEIANVQFTRASAKHFLNLYNSGSMTVNGKDCFGNKASFTLTVQEDFTYQIQITKPANSFFEANQFRYDEENNVLSDHDMIQAAINAAHEELETYYAEQDAKYK